MLTPFGKFTRKLRIDCGESLACMADKLSVSSAFLSRVETGNAKPPKHWESDIIMLYQLNGAKEKEFKDCFFDTLAYYSNKLDISMYSDTDKDFLRKFAKKLPLMDEETRIEICKIVEESPKHNENSK